MYLLYESLIDGIKKDEIMRYNLRHGRAVRVRDEHPSKVIKEVCKQPVQIQPTKQRQGRRNNRQFRREQQNSKTTEQSHQTLNNTNQNHPKQNSPQQVRQQVSASQEPSPDRAINVKSSTRDLPSEFPEEQEQRVPCTEGCGRSFALKVLQKHVKICRKAMQSKREVFVIKQDPEVQN